MQDKTHKLAAIVFTDIVGYTKRMEENEQKTMQLLQQQREIIFPLVESFGGEVIKEIGDGLMMMFNSAVQAVRFAISVQNRLKDEELTIRAGIHIGDVIFEKGDVFGSAVNTAARIEPLSQANGICISEDVRNQLQNKSDIQTISLGKKDLKGVKEPVEIFEVFIEGISDQQKKNIAWFVKDLWSRMVFQILAGYLVSSWVIKQAVSAIAANYFLSPHLVDLAWVILLSLSPTVFLLAYFHGKGKTTKWSNAELVGFPTNIALTLLLVLFMFKGKDLGATTTHLTVENEDGKTVERTILKSEFTKNLLLFSYDETQNDTSLQWLSYGIPGLIGYDLSQDIYMRLTNALSYINKIKDDGFNDGLNTSLMYKKSIASFYNHNYFVSGDFSFTDGIYYITTRIYKTENGKLVSEFKNEGDNLFSIGDAISVEIKKQIGLNEQQPGDVKDMPLEDIFTKSDEAFELFIKGAVSSNVNKNWKRGIDYIEKAIKIDPGFAHAYVTLAQQYFSNNQLDKVNKVLPLILNNQDKLSEKEQFVSKFFYYIIKQEPKKKQWP